MTEICKHFKGSVTQLLVDEAHIYAGSSDGFLRHFDIRAGEVVTDNIGSMEH